MRQEGVLLRLVEAMHFVDEQHGGAFGKRLGFGNRFAHVAHAGEHGGKAAQVRSGGVRQQARQGRLAGARRPPEDHRMDLAERGQLAQRAIRAEQVFLADVFREALRPHAVGKGASESRCVVSFPQDALALGHRR